MTAPARIDVILVDEQDRDIGRCEKVRAHELGLLHRAVSVFLFDARGRVLLQRRAEEKYHSPGLWSNAACTHPREGETPVEAVHRALRAELGLPECSVQFVFPFRYRADVGGGLTEHEFDHVFVGTSGDAPVPVTGETSAVEWRQPDEVTARLASAPDAFTPWFRLLFPRVAEWARATGYPHRP